MSISDNYSPDKSLGDGSTVEFSGNWKVLSSAYFRLYLEAVATGVQTLQALGVDYTLTFDDDGYIATMTSPPSSAYYVLRARDVTQDQTDPYRTSKGFQGRVIEDSFDKLTAISQDLQNQIDRSPKSPLGSSGFTLPEYSNGKIPYWSAVENAQQNSTKTMSDVEGAVDAVAALSAQSGVRVSEDDQTVGFLQNKITFNTGFLSSSVVNDGGDEEFLISANVASQAQAEAGTANLVAMTPLRTAQAIAALSGGDGRVVNIQAFTASGTYNRTAGCTKAIVILSGATGGGAAAVTNPGTAGGTTSFGSFVSCTGGAGGTLQTVSGALARAASGVATGALASVGQRDGGDAGDIYAGGGTWSIGQRGGNAPVVIDYIEPDATETVTIGAAGVGGAAGTTAGKDGLAGEIIVIELS